MRLRNSSLSVCQVAELTQGQYEIAYFPLWWDNSPFKILLSSWGVRCVYPLKNKRMRVFLMFPFTGSQFYQTGHISVMVQLHKDHWIHRSVCSDPLLRMNLKSR